MSKSSTVGRMLPLSHGSATKPNMAARVMLFVSSAGYEPAYQAASIGVTAAAMREEVHFVFAFDALRQLARGAFGQPLNERESAELTRAEGLGAAAPSRMLAEARQLGALGKEVEKLGAGCGQRGHVLHAARPGPPGDEERGPGRILLIILEPVEVFKRT